MFSQTVEYALRAVVCLADQTRQPWKTADIAAKTKVPPAYLSKVLQELVAQGLVRSQRGAGGGMSLARDPAEITILDVVNAVEPIERIQTCPLDLKSHGVRLCPLHRRMDNALAHVEEALRNSTLAEVLAEPSMSTPLCETGD